MILRDHVRTLKICDFHASPITNRALQASALGGSALLTASQFRLL